MHANITYGELTIDRIAHLSAIPIRLKPWQMDALYQHMRRELVRMRDLRASGEVGRIEFTLPDWYQDGITLRMGE